MDQKDRQHVFISHHSKDDEHITKLTDLLKSKGFDIRNSSIRVKPENQRRLDRGEVKEEVIRRILRSKIVWAGKMIVLIGERTHERPWVNWEIEQANRLGKRIVGVFVRGGSEANIPEPLNKYASSIVKWNSETIMRALDGEENLFQDSNGMPREPVVDSRPRDC